MQSLAQKKHTHYFLSSTEFWWPLSPHLQLEHPSLLVQEAHCSSFPPWTCCNLQPIHSNCPNWDHHLGSMLFYNNKETDFNIMYDLYTGASFTSRLLTVCHLIWLSCQLTAGYFIPIFTSNYYNLFWNFLLWSI